MSRVSRPCHSCGNSRLEHQAGSPCLDSSCHRAFGGYTVRWETACLQLSLSRKMKINKLKFKNKCSLTSVTLFPLVSLSSLLTAPSLLSGLSPRASQKGYLALTCSGTDLISGETSEVSVELSPSSSWTTLAAHQVGWPQWALSHLVLSQVTFPFKSPLRKTLPDARLSVFSRMEANVLGLTPPELQSYSFKCILEFSSWVVFHHFTWNDRGGLCLPNQSPWVRISLFLLAWYARAEAAGGGPHTWAPSSAMETQLLISWLLPSGLAQLWLLQEPEEWNSGWEICARNCFFLKTYLLI